ncbi:MAG: signal recognition particle-docking protein FtsY [Candidatus Rehaiarchaeum fermentans]|nr:signal recognition particle-docking protein FtsY [Candidatus Rehaiarchaeum fermentans]MCW1292256.1 signal recognition particle-docking protein FtsY [Candidatus Rehaiarchaeum fermentans]MCW1292782.1 signal recognition particle-docking protein FtsY [Candidatus Rehaiarchaeum fermentans]MCW1311260.1 signal recognition particle-docking protein FtsY [Candidatus Rehaiarchaeum fermentans]
MFNFLKNKLKKIFSKEEKENKEEIKEEKKSTNPILGKKISEQDLDELLSILVENNVSVEVAKEIIEKIKKDTEEINFSRFNFKKSIKEELKKALEEIMKGEDLLSLIEKGEKPFIILLVGLNGVGKTTTIAKLAKFLKDNNKKVIISASDTFRAAAIEQLKHYGKELGIEVISHNYGADPAAVAFDAIKHANSVKADVVLIDTAGRSDINEGLLKELEKIKRVTKPNLTILILESISGNAIVNQVRTFNQRIGIDGLILTKCDIDEKGGAIISASYIANKPIYFLSVGQSYNDLIKFEPRKIAEFVVKE